jgi:hypothetical protein
MADDNQEVASSTIAGKTASPADIEALLEGEGSTSVDAAPDEEAAVDPPAKAAKQSEAASTTEEESVAKEVAADEEKPKDTTEEKKVGALALQLRRQEKKLVERQQAHAREREDFARERTQLTGEVEAARKLRADAKADPLAWLEKEHGITAQDIARRVLNGGKPAEDETARERDARLAALEKREADREAAAARERDAQRLAQDTKKSETDFVALVRKHASAVPSIQEFDDGELVEEAYTEINRQWRIADREGRKRKQYSDAEIADLLERRYSKVRGPKQSAGAGTERDASRDAPKGSESGNGRRGQSAGDADNTAPTLSARTAGERASVPADPLILDEDEERDAIKRELAEARRTHGT